MKVVSKTEGIQKLCRIRGSHSGSYKGLYLLRYSTVQSGENQQTFQRNMSPPSSGLSSNPSKRPARRRQETGSARSLIHAGLLIGLLFEDEYGGNMFF
jgi:hypothetical protein